MLIATNADTSSEHRDTEVSLFAPTGTPGVAENPVGLIAAVNAISDSEDSVVKLLVAAGIVDDAANIALNVGRASIEISYEWAFGFQSIDDRVNSCAASNIPLRLAGNLHVLVQAGIGHA